jgi:hypothetical protein
MPVTQARILTLNGCAAADQRMAADVEQLVLVRLMYYVQYPKP